MDAFRQRCLRDHNSNFRGDLGRSGSLIRPILDIELSMSDKGVIFGLFCDDSICSEQGAHEFIESVLRVF